MCIPTICTYGHTINTENCGTAQRQYHSFLFSVEHVAFESIKQFVVVHAKLSISELYA